MTSINSKSTPIRIFENLHKKCEKLKWNHTWYENGKSKYCKSCACWFEASKYQRCPCCNHMLSCGKDKWNRCEKNNIRKDTDVLEAFLPDLTKEQWQKIYIMMFQPEFAKKLMEIKEKYEK